MLLTLSRSVRQLEGLVRKVLEENTGTKLANKMPHDLVVYADAGLLRRVLQNLIGNAIRYTPNGKVIVGARTCMIDGVEYVECVVTDNGTGIPPEILGTIFEKGESDATNP